MDKKIEIPLKNIYFSRTDENIFYFLIESHGRYFRADDLKEVIFKKDKSQPFDVFIRKGEEYERYCPTDYITVIHLSSFNGDFDMTIWPSQFPYVKTLARQIYDYETLNLKQILKLQAMVNTIEQRRNAAKIIEKRKFYKKQTKKEEALKNANKFIDDLGK